MHAYQSTGNEFYKHVPTEILDYLVREMTDPGAAGDVANGDRHDGNDRVINENASISDATRGILNFPPALKPP